MFRIDLNRVQKGLINLITNAIKFSANGKTIFVNLEANCSENAKYYKTTRIDVIDEGIGLAKEDQKTLFSQFFKTNNEMSKAINRTVTDFD